MKILVLLCLVMVLAGLVSAGQVSANDALWSDTFNVTDTNNINSWLASRVSGSGIASYKYRFSNDAPADPAEDPDWAIQSSRLSFTGTTNRLFLANSNGTFADLYPLLGGKKYAFSFGVSVSGTDNVDKLGLSLSDAILGNAELVAGQMKQTGQLVVSTNLSGTATLINEWSAGTNYTIRIVVDETVATPTFEMFVNDVSKFSGTVTFANNARYAYFQSLNDGDNDMAGTLDRFKIDIITELKTIKLFIVASASIYTANE
jgi:hypothetical protein